MSLRLEVEEYKTVCKTVLDRDGWKCRVCGYRQNLTVHHIIFRSECGEDVTWNLVTLCSVCHDAVHAYKLSIGCSSLNFVGPGGGADGRLMFTGGYHG